MVNRSIVAFLIGTLATGVLAIEPLQIDQFSGSTKEGWHGGKNGTFSQHVASGGPGGAGDGYLLVSASGFHLGTKNTNQWSGNFLAAGIESISADLKHVTSNSVPLRIRILVFGPGGTFTSSNRTPAVTTSGWTRYNFSLNESALTYLSGGTADLNTTLSNVTDLLIRHDRQPPTLPGSHPPHVTESLGIDNITAIIRRSTVGNLTVSGTNLTFEISDLVPGTSNVLERSLSLGGTSEWVEVESFGTNSVVTNALPASADRGFYRVKSY